MTVLKLRCKAQNYAWGKIGNDSMVARLMKNAFSDFTVDPTKPYAEMWMGTHPSAPSEIAEGEFNGQTLSSWLSDHQDSLGSDKPGSQLSYLLKILSVNKALSIQAHPDKSHAEVLFKALPDKYPDDNHKPEMAIALTPFEALCGFRPLAEIQAFIQSVPELKEAVGDESAEALLQQKDGSQAKDALKQCFGALMTCSEHHVLLTQLQQRLQTDADSMTGDTREVFLRLCKQFPGDVGCFGVFLFNFLHLSPGQAIFLAANEPHAYISGDCVECMACSDNVIRAGLTPKWKDVDTLCQMLTYEMKSGQDNIFVPLEDKSDPHLLYFRPPVKDFALTRIKVSSQTSDYSPPAVKGASLILTTAGAASYKHNDQKGRLESGTVLFLSANDRIVLDVEEELTLYQAYEQ